MRAPEKLGVMRIFVAKKELRSREENTETHPHQKDMGLEYKFVIIEVL